MATGNVRATLASIVPDSRTAGLLLAVATATISGVSVFLNATAVKHVPDAAVFTTLKNVVAVALLMVLALLVVHPSEVRRGRSPDRARLAVIGVLGGGVAFLLFFSGLAMASAPSAAFIHKTMFIWVALMAGPLLGERLGWAPLAALGVLLVGQILILPPLGVTWGFGETFIAAATLLWAGRGHPRQGGPGSRPIADRRGRPPRHRSRRAGRLPDRHRADRRHREPGRDGMDLGRAHRACSCPVTSRPGSPHCGALRRPRSRRSSWSVR